MSLDRMTRQQRHRVLAKAIDSTDPRQLHIWLQSLARTRPKQIAIVRNLLVNALEDEMLQSDYTFCRAALALLAHQEAA